MTEGVIEEFFRTIEAKPKTIHVYSIAFDHYKKFHEMNMEQLLEEAEEDQAKHMIPRKSRIVKRLSDFNAFMTEKYTPGTKHMYMAAVKSFYKNYGVNIPRIGNSKRKSLIEVENQWQGFDRDQISTHLKAHLTLRDRALILLICSSGLPKKEIRNLTRKQFEGAQDEDRVTTFHVRRSKTNFDFYTFCTPEATRAIQDYLMSRKDDSPYLFVSSHKTKISDTGWNWIFHNLNERLGIDRESQQYSQTRSHNYRKYFQSTLQNEKCPIWFVDYCMAHETLDVRSHYHLTDPEKLKEIYKEYMHHLSIDDVSFKLLKDTEYKRIRNENKKQTAELEEMKERMAKLEEQKDIEDEKTNEIMEKLQADPELLMKTLAKLNIG